MTKRVRVSVKPVLTTSLMWCNHVSRLSEAVITTQAAPARQMTAKTHRPKGNSQRMRTSTVQIPTRGGSWPGRFSEVQLPESFGPVPTPVFKTQESKLKTPRIRWIPQKNTKHVLRISAGGHCPSWAIPLERGTCQKGPNYRVHLSLETRVFALKKLAKKPDFSE